MEFGFSCCMEAGQSEAKNQGDEGKKIQ
jgi:hypothetical protein